MKAKQPIPNRAPRRTRAAAVALQTGLIALLLPCAAGLSAQNSLRWDSASADASGLASVYSAHATMARVYPGSGLKVMPLATGFNARDFESLAENLVATGKVPGLAMAIVHSGQIVSARGYGVTDVNHPEAIDVHTVFRLASLSKSFASATTGLLIADGKLRWDSRPLDYIPNLKFSDPTAAARLTVADVLSHRVGLTHNALDRDLEGNQEFPALIQKMAYAPMACAPSECYGYQNIAYSLIGDVVQSASGQTYEQTVARRIFRPLGMFDASYGLEGIAASKRWAKPHIANGRGWTAVYPKPTYYRIAPAAGVNASISDMAKWVIAQTGYRGDVLPGSLLATLHAPLIDTPAEMQGSQWRRQRLNAAGYALGWRVYDYAGHRLVFHGGAVQGYRGVVGLLPERDLGVVILWNSTSAAPSGLLPTILDRAIGVTSQRWIDSEPEAEGLYAGALPETRSLATPAGSNDNTGAQTSASDGQPE